MTSAVRIAFLGTPVAAVPALAAFLDDPDVDVAAVVTNPDRPSGRGYHLRPPPVKVAAEAAGVPVWQPQRAREMLEDLRRLAVDACAVVAYGTLLPRDVLDVGGCGFVNLHFSLLPAWRGAAPVPYTLLHGDAVSGVTCFIIDEGMDTGPVLRTAQTPVAPGETAGDLTGRLADLGASVLVEAVRGLVDGSLSPQPQDHDRATYAPKLSPDDARLDWSTPAVALQRAVRAFNPVPGAWTTLRGERLKVHRARVGDGTARGEPGAVLDAMAEGPAVACVDGTLVLTEVQPAGKARMAGADFANGHRPVGERLA
ncbi:MAG: methionyl-tRNA formyltransferase [Egibacteraceae bacterium]